MWIKKIVEELIEAYSTNNPFEIADAKKIIVCFHDLHEEIMGYYKYSRTNKFIVINSNLNQFDQLFTCCHELGHSEIHPKLNTPFLKRKTLFSIDKIEQEANRFAVEMLMPDSKVQALPYVNLTDKEAARIFGVPAEVCHLKKF